MKEHGSKNDKGTFKIVLKTFFGLEQVLAEELNELGYPGAELLNRAVSIRGNWRDVYFLNLHVRCAISVLVEIANFRMRREEDLYQQALKTDWTKYFDREKTFAVKGAVFSDLFRHSQYPFLLLKDAIADTFRKQTGDRPNVSVKSPQVLFDLYIQRDQATISLNTSGAPLFQRGYRQSAGEAPLNEVVAAGLLRLSGWDRKSDLCDPFCGSGTLLIEAGLLAAGIPSNIERHHYAFRNFSNFDETLWNEIYEAAPKRLSGLPCTIYGSDLSPEMIMKTRRNLRGVPVGRFIEVQAQDYSAVRKAHPDSPLTIITNPPYGERMGSQVEELYEGIGNWLKHEMPGSECWIISSSESALKSVGLKPDRKIRLYNGDLECSFRKYSIYSGSKKQEKDA